MHSKRPRESGACLTCVAFATARPSLRQLNCRDANALKECKRSLTQAWHIKDAESDIRLHPARSIKITNTQMLPGSGKSIVAIRPGHPKQQQAATCAHAQKRRAPPDRRGPPVTRNALRWSAASCSPTDYSAVPSALGGLTSGFGMGPGVPPLPWPLTNEGPSAFKPRADACPGGCTARRTRPHGRPSDLACPCQAKEEKSSTD